MTTVMFLFFTDSTTGNPAFSEAASAGGGFGYRPLLSSGMGA
jgi:hypothetical protein